MYKNKTGPLNKINQILLYSHNYSAHKKNLTDIKACVDTSNLTNPRVQHHKKLVKQHVNNLIAAGESKRKELCSQNKKIYNRIIQISKKQKSIQKQQSIHHKTLMNLRTANQRKRHKYIQELFFENQKMNERLKNSRSKEDYGRQSYHKSKERIKKDLDVLGSYSKRSQSVLQNLVYNSLKIKSKDIPFLPQLITRYKKSYQDNPEKRDCSSNKKNNKFSLKRSSLMN